MTNNDIEIQNYTQSKKAGLKSSVTMKVRMECGQIWQVHKS